ncbi:glycosyltransferase [Streptoalloteichus hindustanus]|uniref:Glycosyltransferase, GT2 family n=1 Tax=Streptoalloteichus hindustanus TaxID=2017 RepID=A0A1M4V9I9_STRHI|nr:glycosyltransferase [Streptoalloteichus hindustanus]SHE65615.1 Glycosyltransferase, GT2 family [Streptoalloteichus hindustanus]
MTGTPRITFVLVSYGGRDLVVRCLESLAEHTTEPYEVVVVDSASPDGTGEWLAENLTTAEVLRMSTNLGFGAGCNLGVQHARTELVCFLNADVELTAGWLEPLLRMLDDNPRVGAVAPLMMNADGSVQEAGSVIGGDGWCRAWGDGDADATPLTFPREVDYASAACLVVRRRAFWQVGGFSPEYEIAYFEDVDLALQLREHGWQTWVQPSARVVHARHGTSSSARATELMRLNHGVFTRRWPEELAKRPPVVGVQERPHQLSWLRDRNAPYRVLLVDDRVPQPDRGRGDPRTMAVVDAWRDADPAARVTFFAASPERAEDYAPALRARGIEVVYGVEDPVRWGRERLGLYDVIVVFRPHNFVALGLPLSGTQPQAVRVYDSEALFHRRPAQFFETAESTEERRRYALEERRLREEEVAAFTWADVAVCVSEDEARWVRQVAPGTPVHVACYPIDVPGDVPGLERREGLVFFGGFDNTPRTPNEFAVLELANDVLPVLRDRHPGLRLRVVGADPSPAVRALSGPLTDVLGRVPDPRPWLSTGRLHVVPMRYGAGVKIKFVDSMAAGLPFVTTPVGGEGLHLGWTARHLVAESAAEMVELCDRLLRDDVLWTEVQQALLDICRTRFSPEHFRDNMSAVMVDCGVLPPAPTGVHTAC